MNRTHIIRSLFLILVLTSSAHTVWSQSTPTSQADLEFADWLFEQEEYERAAGEYYRVLFKAPPEKQPDLLYSIGLCYRKEHNYRQALLTFEKIISAYPAYPRLEDAYYHSAYCSYKLGEYQAIQSQLARMNLDGPLPPRFLLIAGVGRLLSSEWESGRTLLTEYLGHSGTPFTQQVMTLTIIAEEAAVPKHRSGLLAGILSAFFPGSGKMYAGRGEDGLVSLLLCSLLGGLAAYHFINDGSDSVAAWIYTGLGTLFYLGDIYGSVVAAEQYNQLRQAKFQERVKVNAHIILP